MTARVLACVAVTSAALFVPRTGGTQSLGITIIDPKEADDALESTGLNGDAEEALSPEELTVLPGLALRTDEPFAVAPTIEAVGSFDLVPWTEGSLSARIAVRATAPTDADTAEEIVEATRAAGPAASAEAGVFAYLAGSRFGGFLYLGGSLNLQRAMLPMEDAAGVDTENYGYARVTGAAGLKVPFMFLAVDVGREWTADGTPEQLSAFYADNKWAVTARATFQVDGNFVNFGVNPLSDDLNIAVTFSRSFELLRQQASGSGRPNPANPASGGAANDPGQPQATGSAGAASDPGQPRASGSAGIASDPAQPGASGSGDATGDAAQPNGSGGGDVGDAPQPDGGDGGAVGDPAQPGGT